MRFLKDRECKNGINHNTQKDCRAKAPIHISSSIRWDLISWIILAVGIFFGILQDKFGGSIAFILLLVIVGMMIIFFKLDIVWGFCRRLLMKVICSVLRGSGNYPSHAH